jgi:hypothetical protein
VTKLVESVRLPGAPQAIRDLWFDARRRPSFIHDWGGVVKQEGWPATGGILIWETRPGGDGWTREKRSSDDTVVVESEVLYGEKRVTFDGTDGDVVMEVTFTYKAKERTPTWDFLFIRRGQRNALRRTLDRFAIECAAEAELAA